VKPDVNGPPTGGEGPVVTNGKVEDIDGAAAYEKEKARFADF